MAHALESCSQYLVGFGGHEMAAGLKIEAKRLDDFRRAFCEYAAANVTEEMLVPQLRLESMADLSQITAPLVRELQRLAPFGHGNRKPLLCIGGATVAAPPRRVGKAGDHLQLTVRQDRQTIRCIAFQCGDLVDRLSPNTALRLAVEPCLNEFNGRSSVELDVKDFQFAGGDGKSAI